MLTIHINKNAGGLVDYFTNSLSKDDYFFSGDSIKGKWHGLLKDELGLSEAVSRKAFSHLARGQHPITGEYLMPRKTKNRRTSIEYTFACPKSVSIVMALSDEATGRAILNAHRLAVKKAMREIEADMQTQTRIQGRNTYIQTGNIIYARFDHFTARPTRDEALSDSPYVSDPHLHSHCVVMNMTKVRGQYQSIEGSTIHRVAAYYEALYHSHLAHRLREMGFDIRRTENRWEINVPGLTRRTIEKFSNRTLEIEKLAQEIAERRGGISAKTKSELGAKIRVNKSKVKKNVDLLQRWKERLTEVELQAIQSARNTQTLLQTRPNPDKMIEQAIRHHFERLSVLPTKKLLARAMSLGYGASSPGKIKMALARRLDVLYANKGYLEHLTTKAMVRAEDNMIEFAARGKGTRAPIHQSYEIKRGFLNTDQKRAIHSVLSSKDRVQILSGAAGTGKSTMLIEIKEAAAEKGKRIMAFAPSSGASRDVLRSKGFEEADTIAAFFRNKKLQDQARGQIILIDEASLVGVKTMNRIFDTSRKLNARIILSGDPRQHSSPEAGDANRILIEKAGLTPVHIGKILRQAPNPKLKAAVEDLARGQIKQGYAKLEDLKAIVEVEDVKLRHSRLATDYVRTIDKGKSALVVSPTHAEGRVITEAIRSKMKAHGRIATEERTYTIQRNLSYTQAEKQDIAAYDPGMEVQFHQNVAGGFKAGQRYRVQVEDQKTGQVMVKGESDKSARALPLRSVERFEVYKPERIGLASGDLIRLTGNGRTLDKRRIYNGQVYEVRGFTPEGHILLKGGQIIDKDYGNFTYGFVQTSHAAQGKDAEAVFIAQSSLSLPASNAKQFYVSVSRARSEVKIYTDDKAALKEAITRPGERMSAGEIAKHQNRIINRNRRHHLRTITEKIRGYEYGRKPSIKAPIHAPHPQVSTRGGRDYGAGER